MAKLRCQIETLLTNVRTGSTDGSFMKTLCFFLLISLPLCAQGVQREYITKGRKISYSLTVFDPPTKVTAENGPMNQDNPINCIRLFWFRLRNLNITDAAQLYTNPQREIEMRAKYKERVGDQTFRRMHADIFKDAEPFPYELVIGKTHALVSAKHSGSLLLFIDRDGTFWMDNTESEQQRSQEAKDLITLVNAYGDGQLRFR